MLGVLLIAISLFPVFEFAHDQTRCWAPAQREDGGYVWAPRQVVGGPNSLIVGAVEGGINRSFCVGDIITNSEATLGLVIVAMAAAIVLGVSRRGRATTEHGPTREG